MISVREAVKDDAGNICNIAAEYFGDSYSLHHIESQILSDDYYFAVAVDSENNIPLAYISVMHVLDEAYITSIAVNSSYKRQGLASLLMNQLISYAGEKQFSFVSLEVRSRNYNAVSMYEKFGFLKKGEMKHYYRDPADDAIIYTLSLT